MGIYDRTANREPHTHSAGFGGEEGVEQSARVLGRDPDATIGHTYQHLLRIVRVRTADDVRETITGPVGAPIRSSRRPNANVVCLNGYLFVSHRIIATGTHRLIAGASSPIGYCRGRIGGRRRRQN